NKLAVAGGIAAVKRCAAVDDVVGTPPGPASLLAKSLECRHQMRDTVDHGDVDRLSPARLTRFHRSREQTHHQIKHVGAEIAEQRSSEWRRTDPAHLDDAKAVQRSRHDKISSLSGGTGRHRRWSRGQRALR